VGPRTTSRPERGRQALSWSTTRACPSKAHGTWISGGGGQEGILGGAGGGFLRLGRATRAMYATNLLGGAPSSCPSHPWGTYQLVRYFDYSGENASASDRGARPKDA
jgi:hypothetical protein